MNANTNTPKTAEAPMQGLAEWLRKICADYERAGWGDIPLVAADIERNRRWADEVDAALAAPQPEATRTEAGAMQGLADHHRIQAKAYELRSMPDRAEQHTRWADEVEHAAQAPTAVQASAMGESRELAWTDDDGTHHSMSVESATKTLAELFKAWPAGLDEIEASVGGWRGRAQNLEEKIAALATAAVQGDASSVPSDDMVSHAKAMVTAGYFDAKDISEGDIRRIWITMDAARVSAPAAPGPAASSAVPIQQVEAWTDGEAAACSDCLMQVRDWAEGLDISPAGMVLLESLVVSAFDAGREGVAQGAAASPALAPEQSHG